MITWIVCVHEVYNEISQKVEFIGKMLLLEKNQEKWSKKKEKRRQAEWSEK